MSSDSLPNKAGRLSIKRILGYGAYLLFLVMLVELTARFFWVSQGLPFGSAHRKLHWAFYPELRQFDLPVQQCSDCVDVLLLGGSVLMRRWGSIEHTLKEKLARSTGRQIRIYNLAAEAQTSLDTYNKYRWLRNRNFDLVLVYDGINDVRMNNAPAEVFQSNYSHYPWYKLLESLEPGQTWLFVLPFTIRFVAVNYFGPSLDLPRQKPRADWLEYGCDIKTAAPFRANLEGVLGLADQKKETILLLSYNYYLPANYSEERFRQRALDYTTHALPVELWGKPACVAAGVDAHNAILKELAEGRSNVIFVDQQQLIPKEGRFFNDVCHLTTEGSERFVNNILEPILNHLRVGAPVREGTRCDNH